MTHPFPYPPISSHTLEAIARIECATSLNGLERDFEAVRAEAFRHYGPSVLIALLTALPLVAGFAVAQRLGWFGPEYWPYALTPVVVWAFMPASEYLMRGPRRVEDERRVRDALNVWKVLERKGKAT
jgi:hypothetical protein